jgi:hypothetical protein
VDIEWKLSGNLEARGQRVEIEWKVWWVAQDPFWLKAFVAQAFFGSRRSTNITRLDFSVVALHVAFRPLLCAHRLLELFSRPDCLGALFLKSSGLNA